MHYRLPFAFLMILELGALPSDPSVLAGEASIHEKDSFLEVTASHRSIIDWGSFSIDAGEAVRFIQPSIDAATLNRVTGSSLSQILGTLSANGKIYLINPQGVLIGPDAIIDTAAFLASTLSVSEGAFLESGALLFAGDSLASVVNLGTIRAASGDVHLFAHLVEQKGTIQAHAGAVSIASTHKIALQPDGQTLLSIVPDLPSDGIELAGQIEALSARIEADGAYSLGIKQAGEISLVQKGGKLFLGTTGGMLYLEGDLLAPGGSIALEVQQTPEEKPIYFLGGAKAHDIAIKGPKCLLTGSLMAEEVSLEIAGAHIETTSAKVVGNQQIRAGTLFSSGTKEARGGSISLTADQIVLAAARIDASGDVDGGKIEILSPSEIKVNSFSRLMANGFDGNGGNIVIRSADKNECYATLEASGEVNGGAIDVSAPYLTWGGTAAAAGKTGKMGTLLLDPVSLEINETTGIYPQCEFIEPLGSGGSFGSIILPLSTGNVLITNPTSNFAAAAAGAVYLYNGLTGGLISTLTGGRGGDGIGFPGAIALTGNGNAVIRSNSWNNPAPVITQVGAATWINGATGLSGIVSASNSFIGSTANDFVSGTGIVALTNGNYVIRSTTWHNGVILSAGAATWGDGSTGQFSGGGYGAISASNSFIGGRASDQVSSSGIMVLNNGNYVVLSANWDQPAPVVPNVGAATWGNGSTGEFTGGGHGLLSASNSLVGVQANDLVGSGGTGGVLTNGNYVVVSSSWHNGLLSAGAATWGDGSIGTVGSVTSANSFVGSTASDFVGSSGLTVLTNGNYVVLSRQWNIPLGNTQVGAATWGRGTDGTFGPGGYGAVSTANSFIGTTNSDQVSSSGITALLVNGNYVVVSPSWNTPGGGAAFVGATTWGNGSDGTLGPGGYGAVSAANSFIGTTANDNVGFGGITRLTNGNYVVNSPSWQTPGGGGLILGAATWGNGSDGTLGPGGYGAVSAANSFIVTTANDSVSSSFALTNGNYIVTSIWSIPFGNAQVGAVTWGNGSDGTFHSGGYGAISAADSLTGTATGDVVGSTAGIVLTNGNYVALSPSWNNPLLAVNNKAGAATWVNGSNGTSALGVYGAISSADSFIGSTANDGVGTGGKALTNGNYVVRSPNWDGPGGNTQVGAATWGDGSNGQFGTGLYGAVSSLNSFIGTTASDQVSTGGVVALTNGNYVVRSQNWDGPSGHTNAGAATFGNGLTGQTLLGTYGALSSQNSVIGGAATTTMGTPIEDPVNGTFLTRFATEVPVAGNTGVVRIGLTSPNQITYSRCDEDSCAGSLIIPSAVLTGTLNAGTNVSVQANDTITISSPITVNNPAGSGGNLSFAAGKSLLVNADIFTDNGSLTLIANDLLANGVVDSCRSAGAAELSIASGVTIDTGSGSLLMDLRDGAGKTNSTSGDATLNTGVQILPVGDGSVQILAAVNNINLLAGSLIESQNGSILLIAGKDIIANTGAAAIQATGSGLITLVTDDLFPTPPGIGNGIFNIPDLSINSASGSALLYTGHFGLGTFPANINGSPFDLLASALLPPTYYPSGKIISPFAVYYKDTPSAAIFRGLRDLRAVLAEPFADWLSDAYGGLLGWDIYPPTGTLKGLNLIPPSLCLDVKLKRIQIESSLAFLDRVRENFTEQWEGRSLDAALLSEIKQEALRCCKENGCEIVSVSFPHQELTQGELTLCISQPQIEKVAYCGNRWLSDSRIESVFNLHEGDTLDQRQILNQAAWFNRNPFQSSQIILSPGQTKNHSNLTLCIRDRFPLRVFTGVDNTGTEFSKSTRIYAGVNWGNAFWVGDLLTYQFTTGPSLNDFQSHYLNYTSYLPWKHQLIIYGGYARMHPTIPDFHSTAIASQGSLRYTIPLLPLYRSLLQEVSFGFDFKNLNSNLIFLGTFQFLPVVTHSVNLTQAYGAYDLNWETPIHDLTFKVEGFASFIKWLPNQNNPSYNALRLGAVPRYFYGRIALGDVIQLPQEFETSFLLRGQGSQAALLPSEQFPLGGNNTVRGYDENAYLADNAICASAEIHTPSLTFSRKMGDELYLIVFLDAAKGWDFDTAGTFKSSNLVGAGPGLRYSLPNYVYARLDYGFQLHGIPGDRSLGRLHFSLTASY